MLHLLALLSLSVDPCRRLLCEEQSRQDTAHRFTASLAVSVIWSTLTKMRAMPGATLKQIIE
jgi:hypothetical protein